MTFCLWAKGPYVFEGIWSHPTNPSIEFMMNKIASAFLPYNPVAVQIQSDSCHAFSILEKKYPQGTFIHVPNFTEAINFRSIDLLRIGAEEPPYRLLQKMPPELYSVKVVSLNLPPKTQPSPLRLYLSSIGFKLLFSYFAKEEGGEAIFLREDIYHAVFE